MKTSQDDNKSKEMKLQFLISEYEKLKDEILQSNTTQNQTLLVALGSASISIPILVGQSSTIATPTLAALLYALSIIYSVLTMNYLHTGYAVGTAGKYIYEKVEPRINQLLQDKSSKHDTFWEEYIRKERSNIVSFLLDMSGSASSLLLILIPSFASLIAAQYMLLTPAPQNISTQFITTWITPLSIIAWVSFVLSIINLVLLSVYSLFKNKWTAKS